MKTLSNCQWILVLALFFLACKQEKKYTVIISSMDEETKIVKEMVEEFKAKDDTTAYKDGCSKYWVEKALRLQMNKLFEKSDPIPFYFIVIREDKSPVSLPKEEAERLTKRTVDLFKNKIIPDIDTIVPISKRVKEEPANVY